MPHKALALARAGAGATSSRPVMVAICGDSAVGKTTLTRGLAEALGPDRITTMCTDDYHRFDREERRTKPFTPLHPDCNYVEIMEQHLTLLAAGQPILKPVYDHRNGTLARPELIEPRDIVVVEGLHPLLTKVSRACFDITVFLDPPEDIRRAWKVKRDVAKRGYTPEQVLADLDKREPESEAFIRPQKRHADVVVRFAPIDERGETSADPLSANLLLRPTIPHPPLSDLIDDGDREAMHLKLVRDDTGRPVDALHIHAYADPTTARRVQELIWKELGVDTALPDSLGRLDGTPGTPLRSEPLALTQLLLLYHVLLQRTGGA